MKGKITISKERSPINPSQKSLIMISIIDSASKIEFLNVEIGIDEFSEALFGLARLKCDYSTKGLENIGNKLQSTSLEFVVPPHNSVNIKEIAKREDKKLILPGWTSSFNFNKNNSFFYRGGVEWARTTMYCYVVKGEDNE